MVAIVTGNGLGLQSSSLGLGSKGQIGNAAFGQGGEQLYVNAANGNLVIRDRDELLLGQGIASELYRAYNSQGQLNGDAWRPGVSRTVDGLTGTLNTAGSTITRTNWDGSSVVYAYDATSQTYVATTGQGARDTLSYNAASKTWTWTQGSTRVTETYDATHNGRITTTVDTSGNTMHYAYNAQGLLSSVTTASGEVTYLDYSGTQLTQLRTVLRNPDGSTRTQTAVRYSYDSLGRMSQVTVDLSPDDNSIADGKVYITTYTYDGSSSRIASITSSDGSQVAFTYQQVNGEYRVDSIAETADTGVVRVTTLTYANGQTTIIDPLGQRTVLSYDSNGRLTQLDSPAVDGVVSSQRFTYDANGNVTSITDAQNNVVTFAYDARGNLIKQEQALFDGGKLIVERTYGSHNELLTETTYRDPGGAVGNGMHLPSGALTTHYAYDSRGLLRFAITPEGRVTEYRYNGAGQQTSAISYSGNTYAGGAYGESDLASWVSALGDKRQAIRTDTTYDFRGNVAGTTQYSQLLASGEGDASAALTQTLYVYDPFGRLIQRYVGTPGAMQMQQFSYDGLGRLLTATQFDGTLTTYLYDDASHQVSVTYSNGLVRTTVYNLAGEAISLIESAQGKVLSQTFNSYDALGRLTKQIDANGGRTHYLYDAASRLVGEVGPDGALTEYRYTPNGQIGEALRYATPLSAAVLASLDAGMPEGTSGIGIGGPIIPPPTPAGTFLSANHVLDAIRPSASANDRSDWRLYDQAGQLVRSVDSAGIVMDYVYDGAGRLTSSTVYATPIDTAVLIAAAQDGSLSPQTGGTPANISLDRTTRYLYDNDGLLRGQLDAEGYLTQYRYNAAGQLIETIRYATPTPVGYRGHATQLADWLPAPNARDTHSSYYYDSRGLLTTEVDGEGWLTTYTYDAYGNVASRMRGQRIDPAQGGAPQQVPIRFEAKGSIGQTVDVWVDGVKVGSVTLTSADYTFYTLTASNLVPLINHTIELKSTTASPIQVRNVSFGAQSLANDASGSTSATLYTLDALQTLLAWSTLPGQLEQTQYAYDADGRLLSVTQVGLDGVVGSTAYTYDSQGRVTSETRDGRTVTYRYDLQGRLIGQLGGEGSAALAALGSNASQAAIDAVWNQYGVRYGYDAGDRRVVFDGAARSA